MIAQGDDWRWWLGESGTVMRSSIDVIEPATPREIPSGARRVAFGFSRALEEDTIAALDQWDRDHRDGWDDYAEAVAG